MELGAGTAQHGLPQGQDQTGLLCQGYELCRADHAPLRVAPAGQGLGTDELALMVHHRLVMHQQLAARQALAQVSLQVRAGIHRRLHFRVKEALGVAARSLGLVHRQVGPLEQFVHREAMLPKQGDANAGRAVVPRPAQLKRLVQTGQQFVCHRLCL